MNPGLAQSGSAARGRRPAKPAGSHTKRVPLTLTLGELRLLAALASDQLFRREFIDPRMPGYKANGEEIRLGRSLVARLQLIAEKASTSRTSPTTE